MEKVKGNIIILDWCNNVLFKGHYSDEEVDKVLDANRCEDCSSSNMMNACENCDDTGYSGDIEVFWVDIKRKDNVYDYVSY